MSQTTYPHFEPHFPREEWVLGHVLEHQAKVRPNRPFLSWQDGAAPLSFSEVNALANRHAHGFAAAGVKKRDMVGILLPNSLEFIFTWFGLAKIGAVEVAISEAYKGSFLAHPIRLSSAKILVTTAALAERLAEIEEDIPTVETCYLVETGDGAPAPSFRRIKTRSFSELDSGNSADPGVKVEPRDISSVLMTSGTTGSSKGVVMTHSHFYFFAEEGVQLVKLTDEDTHMTGFPLFHGNAQFLTVYPCLIAGAYCVLYPRFSASDFIGRARRSGATVCNLLGATMSFVVAQPPSDQDRDHKLRRIYAAPLSPDLAGVFAERFGVNQFLDGFGQTEISNIFMTPDGNLRPAGACGKLVDQFFEVKLVGAETGEPVAEGEVGELLIRPKIPGITCWEYLGMPEKTVEAWRDLWFHTGDGLKRDSDGWYYFVDRVKDALRRRGENISSFEVEMVVRSHPAVAECAVVAARADEKAGEDEVFACVVLQPAASVHPEEIVAWCESRMPAFMVPRFIEFFAALPQTASEKVRKKELRDRGVTERTWDRLKSAPARD